MIRKISQKSLSLSMAISTVVLVLKKSQMQNKYSTQPE
jgi:hypothetical protein